MLKIFLIGLWVGVPAGAYNLTDYGRECSEKLGAELPRLNCLEGELLPVEVNGAPVVDRIPPQCDKPSLVVAMASCIPGARLLRRETILADKTRVITMAICRHSKLHPLNDSRFENISIFQHNTKNNSVCWLQIRNYETGVDSRDLPPPFTKDPKLTAYYTGDRAPEKFYEPFEKVVQGDSQCINCHDSQLYLKTPYAAQAKKNTVPRITRHGRLNHVGLPFAAWNEDKNQPARIQIQKEIYDNKFPEPPETPEPNNGPKLAAANTCTRCHSIGKSPLGFGQGSCDAIVKDFIHGPGSGPVTKTKLSVFGRSFPMAYWMPPQDEWPKGLAKLRGPQGATQWKTYYGRAIEAVKLCCNDPQAEFHGKAICHN